MRFGIMAMQINSLIPPGLAPEGVMAHIAGFEHADLVSNLADHGFDLIELGGDLTLFLPRTFSPAAIERLAELKRERGLSFTLHLPLWSVEPSTPLVPVREGSVRALIEAIQATRSLDPEVYVLHATGALASEFYRRRLPETWRAMILRLFQSGARQSIGTILAETGIPSRKLAIETIEFPLELTLELAEELDLSICFDTGHVLAGFSGNVDFFAALERCLPRLAEVHLHDCPQSLPGHPPGHNRDHQPLGNGDLDTGRFFARLAAAGYCGPIIFELRVDETMASMDFIRTHQPEFIG